MAVTNIPTRGRMRRLLPEGLALTLLVSVGVAVNCWWVVRWRAGLPFDIDEAGYLFRAFRDANYLRSGGPLLLAHNIVMPPGIQAPALPVIAGIVQFFTRASPYELIFVLEVFYVLAILASYALVRRQASSWWSLLAAGAAAATPGILTWARSFAFALPAAACVALALAAQLWAGDFRSRRRSLLWGLALGVSTLTRTMVLGIVPALLLAGIMRLFAYGELRWRGPGRLGNGAINFGLGVLLAGFVAATWYTAALPGVLHYLVSYGYGKTSAQYGPAHPIFSWSWWAAPFRLTVDTELFLPLTLALAAAGLLGTLHPLHLRLKRTRHRGNPIASTVKRRKLLPPAREATAPAAPVSSVLAGDTASIIVFLVLAYLALASTRNQGSGFELLLIPAIVALAVISASHAPKLIRPLGVGAVLIAAGLSFADQAGLLPGGLNDVTWVTVGPIHALAFDAQGNLFSYASAVFGGCPTIVTCVHAGEQSTAKSYVRTWAAPTSEVANFLHRFAAARGREPVVLFAVQDPFFNVNSLSLAAAYQYRQEWPIGVVSEPQAVHASYRVQLEAARFGEPNFLIIGPPSHFAAARAFSPLTSDAGVVSAARAEGFRQVGHFTLPDHRVMTVWWHPNRGPVLPADQSRPGS